MPIDWTVERLDACARVVSTRMSYTELEVAENTTETPENAVRVIGIKVSDMNHAGNETVLVRTALEKALDATQATPVRSARHDSLSEAGCRDCYEQEASDGHMECLRPQRHWCCPGWSRSILASFFNGSSFLT